MEVHEKITEIVDLVESARSMPLSSSVLVNKAELLRLLDELHQRLPDNLSAADAVLAQREALLAEARGNAERLVDKARAEQARLVADHTVLAVAREDAGRLRAQAQEEAMAARRDADDYLDAKLAHLELAAERIADTARSGRERLRGTTPYEQLGPGTETPPMLPQGADATPEA